MICVASPTSVRPPRNRVRHADTAWHKAMRFAPDAHPFAVEIEPQDQPLRPFRCASRGKAGAKNGHAAIDLARWLEPLSGSLDPRDRDQGDQDGGGPHGACTGALRRKEGCDAGRRFAAAVNCRSIPAIPPRSILSAPVPRLSSPWSRRLYQPPRYRSSSTPSRILLRQALPLAPSPRFGSSCPARR